MTHFKWKIFPHIDIKGHLTQLQKSLLLLQHVEENVWEYECIDELIWLSCQVFNYRYCKNVQSVPGIINT